MKAALIICSLLLLIGITDLPIGYYSLLRIAVCITSGIVIFSEFDGKFSFWVIVFGLMAILFNPLIPVYLNDKETWIPIDIICAIVCVVKAFLINKSNNSDDPIALNNNPINPTVNSS